MIATVKICKLAGESVWQCRAYNAAGHRMPNADCEESSRRCAEDTAAAMVRPYFDQLADAAAAAIETLPILSRKYAAAVRDELRHRAQTTCDSADGSAETAETVRSLLAGAFIDILAMSIDFGGHYPPGCHTAENGGREWRAIFAEATRQVAGAYAAEYAEHCRAMAAIDAENLAGGLTAAR